MIIFAMLLMIVSVHAAKIDVNDVSPQPVSPGGDLTMRVAYTNVGSTSERITSNLSVEYPFTLKTSDSPTQFDLCALCSRTVTYFLSVESSAQSGIYPIFVKTGGTSTTVDVSVSGRPNIVLFSDLITNATPSERFDMPVTVKNIGTGTAREIKVTSRSADFVTLGGSTVVVDSTGPKESDIVVFQMVASNKLVAGGYNVQFEISYLDDLGASYSSNQSIGVQIVNSGLLSVQNIKAAASTGGQPIAGAPITVVVRLQNVGHGDIDYMESSIQCDGQNVKAFLGQLKRDEDAPAVFELTLPQGKRYQCSVETTYTDDLGQHSVTSNFDLNVKNPDFPIIVPVIIVIAAGFYFYRKRKKK